MKGKAQFSDGIAKRYKCDWLLRGSLERISPKKEAPATNPTKIAPTVSTSEKTTDNHTVDVPKKIAPASTDQEDVNKNMSGFASRPRRSNQLDSNSRE